MEPKALCKASQTCIDVSRSMTSGKISSVRNDKSHAISVWSFPNEVVYSELIVNDPS